MNKRAYATSGAICTKTPPKGLVWIPSREPKEGKEVLILGWINCDKSGICFRSLKHDEQYILDRKTDLNYGIPLKKPNPKDIYKKFNKDDFSDGVYWFLSNDGGICLSFLKHDHDNTPFFKHVDIDNYGMVWDPDSITHFSELIIPCVK